MTLTELIIEYRQQHDLSQRQFAAQCNLSNGYISMLENGTNPNTGKPVIPSITALKKLAKGMNISLPALFERTDNTLVNLSPDEEDPLTIPGIFPLPRTVKKPRLGKIACGEPILTEENFDGYDAVPIEINCDFTLVAQGDSMIGARIFDGDIVYIRHQNIVENGQIAVVMIDGEKTLKRFYKKGDTVTLMPENPNYEPLVYVGEELQDIRILGRAVGFTSYIR